MHAFYLSLYRFFYWFSILGEKPLATHGLVFMLDGKFNRWKQIVAYHYTPDGFDGAHLKPILENYC